MRTTRQPRLAKLTRPRLHRAAARERLFSQLDQARADCPAVYVCGPPGAGKTTLIASWLAARHTDGIWYQVDAGDTDLPTFFHYLASAAKPFARKAQSALPALTPEHLHDVGAFSRRFFRALFSRLPRQAAIVLDNCQEADPSSELHRLIAQAIVDVPDGCLLVLISREDAPGCYARHITHESLWVLSPEHLKLTLDEALAIAKARNRAASRAVTEIHARCGGWTAGFTLMLEQADERFSTEPFDPSNSLGTLFDYFAGQIYERLAPRQQRILLMLSFLPSMARAAVQSMTRDDSAWSLLEELYRRRLFVDARSARFPQFQFHALFLAFLRERACRHLDPPTRRALNRRAGDTLLMQQDLDASFAAYLAGDALESARGLILAHSAQLISHGRWKTAVQWIESLPADMVGADCWLQHWLGRARMAVSAVDGRRHLDRGYRLALGGDEGECALLCAVGVLESHILGYTDFRPLDGWIEVITAVLARGVVFRDADTEVRVLSALLIALSYRRPDDPGLDACAARVFELLPVLTDVNMRVTATSYLVGWGSTTGPLEVAKRAVPQLRAAVDASGVTALNAALGWFLISWYHCLLREDRECRVAIETVEAIATSEDLPSARKFGPIIRAWLEMHTRDLSLARSEADRLDALINPANLYDRASVEGIRAWLAVLDDQPETALMHATAAVEIFDRTGSIMHQLNHRLPGVWARVLQRDFVDARVRLDEMRSFANRTRSCWQEMELRVTEAWMALEERDWVAATSHLDSMMRLARERRLDHVFGRHLQRRMPTLCAAALEAGIEVEYVRAQIRRWGWSPPASRPEHWPWRIRVYTLGTFGVYVDDRPLTFARKVPRKPIALLKALVAFGPQAVPVQRIVDSLWPDEDGDAAHKSLEAALHRLRQLLGPSNVIDVRDNRISFDQQSVWTDKEAFELATRDIDDERSLAQAIDLYRGPFLPGDLDAACSAPARERLQAQCLRMLERAGKNKEATGAHLEAINGYARGIEIDEMHEAFYQGLMRAYAALERPVDAIRIYQKLERVLEQNLGIKPSRSTRSLAAAVAAGAR